MTVPYIAQPPSDDFGQRISDIKYSAILAATTDTTLTVPAQSLKFKVVMRMVGTGSVWIALNGTAAVPAGATFSTTTSELLNQQLTICREVRAGDILHFYTASANQEVSLSFYALNTTNGI